MESSTIILDKGYGEEFDERVRGEDVLQDFGDLEIVTKTKGTVSGRPIVMFTFHVQTPEGKKRVQTVTTARLLVVAARMIMAKHPDLLVNDG